MAMCYSLLIGVILLHVASSKWCPFQICVRTQQRLYAGTDEDVYIRLFSKRGRKTPWILMDDLKKNDFESGSFYCYALESLHDMIPTKQVAKVGVKLLGNRGYATGWDIDYITVMEFHKCRSFPVLETLDSYDPALYKTPIGYCLLDNKQMKSFCE